MFKSVYLTTLGCNKNQVDSEVVLGKIVDKMMLVLNPTEAEVVIVNTCAFIGDAQEESVETILDLIECKKQEVGLCKCFIVIGCLPQRYINELEKELPEVDLFIGTGEYQNIGTYIKKFWDKHSSASYVNYPKYIHSEKESRFSLDMPFSRYLKISEGCSRKCTYCIIPTIRGELRSRTVKSLIIEANNLIKSGAKEINVISQDLSSYGDDLSAENSLYKFLYEMDKIEKVDWIRLFYYYPDDLTDEVIDLMASSKKICNYLDIPIQHFSTSVLKRMGRKITGPEIYRKLKRIREKMPEIVLRTSLIVGFPGETEDDFNELLKGVSDIKFDHLGVFKFSSEIGTPAEKLQDKISQEIMDDRFNRVYELQNSISNGLLKKYVGKEVEVYIEGHHLDTDLLIVGRHQGQAPEIDGKVIINDIDSNIKKDIKQGQKVLVKINEAHDYDLVGVAQSIIN